ncbi:Epithelial splicing regulatory protein 1-like protein [Drosera capensis]
MYSYYNSSRGYGDLGDGQELGSKRQRVVEQGSSYYAPTPGSGFTYNPTPYSPQVSQNPFPVVRLRGLPFGCKETDVSDFFQGLSIVDVLLTHKGGRFSGEAYCVLGYQHQVEYALQRNRQNIGRRYVEVFRSTRHEYYKAIASEVTEAPSGSPHRNSCAKSYDEAKDLMEHSGILRLRGLPYSAIKGDIVEFFKDFVLLEDKVHIAYNSDGRPSGDAFVEFAGPEESKAAMSMDRKTLGSRYVELFPTSKQEMVEAIAKGRKVDVEGGEPSVVHTGFLRMRGLPFSAGKEDIVDFFKEFVIPEDNIHIMYNPDGRRTGEAFVMFSKPDHAKAAMTKDRKTLGSRYIELFVSSPQELDEALSGSGARR